MTDREQANPLRMFYIPIARKLFVYLVILAIYSILVDEFESVHIKSLIEASGAVIGTLIFGVLLAFRTNAAYDRWWEGRKLWGQLVNEERNLAIKIKTFVAKNQYLYEFTKYLIGFPLALKENLRKGATLNQIPGFEHSAETPKHVPLYLAQKIVEQIKQIKLNGTIDGFEQMQMDVHARAIMDICGSCERIKTTPIPASYRGILRAGIALNVLGLPWYLAPDYHLWNVPIVLVTSFFLIGLELLAEEIEEPFGTSPDDLQLDRFCLVIENSTKELLG